MTELASAIYVGRVVHQRFKPRRHRLRYRVFSLFLDLDELSHLDRRLRLFSYNRAGILSFRDADHGNGAERPLRPWVEAQLRAAGIADHAAMIRLLCYPRMFGYVFNPLSVYFCYSVDGTLIALLYEVNNTFGQRHCYLFPVFDSVVTTDSGHLEHSCDKKFYVSPFIPMQGRYQFKVDVPTKSVTMIINNSDPAGYLLHASFVGRRAPLSDRCLLRCLITHPLMTAKVIAGIHWEALRLWLKGVPLVSRPEPPADLVTVVAPEHR